MGLSATVLTESEYYSSDFNGAIFDEPFRLYFAQYQENLALRVYFQLRQILSEFKEGSKSTSKNSTFILLYPSKEAFLKVFPEKTKNMNVVNLSCHKVIACYLPFKEKDYGKFTDIVKANTRFLTSVV